MATLIYCDKCKEREDIKEFELTDLSDPDEPKTASSTVDLCEKCSNELINEINDLAIPF